MSMDKLSGVDDNDHGEARRTFLKKAAYVTPAILTLKAVPSFASYGSAPAPTGQADDGVGGGFTPHPHKGHKDKAPKDKPEKHGKSKKDK
jgi:hypothetical protein